MSCRAGLAAVCILLLGCSAVHAQTNIETFDTAELVREDQGPVEVPSDSRTHIFIPLIKVHLPEIDLSEILEPMHLKSGPAVSTFRVSGQCINPDTVARVHLRDSDGWPNPDDALDTITTTCSAQDGQFVAEFDLWCTQSMGLLGDVNQLRGFEGTSGEEDPQLYVTDAEEITRIPVSAGDENYWIFHCSDRYDVISR